MKFEVKYPTGARHEVELKATMVILGRDPSCDLVLNDVKCSRRHAVVEVDARGLVVRDSGSANGIFVNGRKVERKHLKTGDVLRLGDVQLTVLEGEVGRTVVMTAEEILAIEKDAAAPPRPSGNMSALAALKTETGEEMALGRSGPIPRPTTVSVLAAIWAVAAVVFALGGIAAIVSLGLSGIPAAAAAGGGFLLGALSALLAFGLWSRARWARLLQVGLAGLGVLVCPVTLPSATALVYMLRPEARIHFSGRRDFRDLQPDEAKAVMAPSSDPTFAFAIVATLVVSLAVTATLGWLWLRSRP